MSEIVRRFFKVAVGIWLFGALIFVILIAVNWRNYSLIVGWTMGFFVSISCLLWTSVLSDKFLKRVTSKRKAFFWGFFKFTTNVFYAMFFIWLMFLINPLAHGHTLWNGARTQDFYSPINIFTMLGGLAISFTAIFIAHIPVPEGWAQLGKKAPPAATAKQSDAPLDANPAPSGTISPNTVPPSEPNPESQKGG